MHRRFAPSAWMILGLFPSFVSAVNIVNDAPQMIAKDNSTSHARELMGSRYRKSDVSWGEKFGSSRWLIRSKLKVGLPKKWKKAESRLAATIQKQAKKFGLDPLFVLAMIETESSFNPSAKGTSGEIGLMQILPDTAKWIATEQKIRWLGADSLEDPAYNVIIGTTYVDYLRKNFDAHSRLYVAAYNMGPKNVRRALDNKIWPKDYALKVMDNYLKYYSELKEVLVNAKQKADKTRTPASTETATIETAEQTRVTMDSILKVIANPTPHID